VTQPAPEELSDEELVIRAAVEDRERVRSGRGMRAQAAAIVGLAALACWLVLVLARVPFVGYIGAGLGVVVAVMMIPIVSGRFAAGPVVAWGRAVRDNCPQCGQRTLREDRVIHGGAPGPLPRAVDAIVTLCMADECGYAAARRLRCWPVTR
jgi:hypothetical protein